MELAGSRLRVPPIIRTAVADGDVSRRLRILICLDHDDEMSKLHDFLLVRGHHPRPLKNSGDLAVLVVGFMPGMVILDSQEKLEVVRRQPNCRDLPVILVSDPTSPLPGLAKTGQAMLWLPRPLDLENPTGFGAF